MQRGLDTDLELGNALAEISDASLYRATRHTFEAYLLDRWDIRRSPDYELGQAPDATHPPSTDLQLPVPKTDAATRGCAEPRCNSRLARQRVGTGS